MTLLGFRKQELSTCRSIASIATGMGSIGDAGGLTVKGGGQGFFGKFLHGS